MKKLFLILVFISFSINSMAQVFPVLRPKAKALGLELDCPSCGTAYLRYNAVVPVPAVVSGDYFTTSCFSNTPRLNFPYNWNYTGNDISTPVDLIIDWGDGSANTIVPGGVTSTQLLLAGIPSHDYPDLDGSPIQTLWSGEFTISFTSNSGLYYEIPVYIGINSELTIPSCTSSYFIYNPLSSITANEVSCSYDTTNGFIGRSFVFSPPIVGANYDWTSTYGDSGTNDFSLDPDAVGTQTIETITYNWEVFKQNFGFPLPPPIVLDNYTSTFDIVIDCF